MHRSLDLSDSLRTPSLLLRRLGPSALAALLSALTFAASIEAKPGTHPVVVSTWDARASSVALQYRRALFDGGGFDALSYHANFSSTGGTLSSQFGLYYVNFKDGSSAPTAHGLAGSATAVFNLPVSRRFENGLPMTAIDFYVGSAPTALVSGKRNYLTVPLVLGLGVPISPAKAISIVPWFEFSPSFNLDTVIHPYEFTPANIGDFVNPATGQIRFDATAVENILSDSVELETSAAVGARAGLDLSLHVSDYFDVNANATLSSVGSAFQGTRVVYLGVGLVWRWDDIVPAVLPAHKRLLNEDCDDVETRFRSCPNSRNWKRPEELQGVPAAEVLTPAEPNLAPMGAAEKTALPPPLPPVAAPTEPPGAPPPPASGTDSTGTFPIVPPSP